jgi:hypothetical protein
VSCTAIRFTLNHNDSRTPIDRRRRYSREPKGLAIGSSLLKYEVAFLLLNGIDACLSSIVGHSRSRLCRHTRTATIECDLDVVIDSGKHRWSFGSTSIMHVRTCRHSRSPLLSADFMVEGRLGTDAAQVDLTNLKSTRRNSPSLRCGVSRSIHPMPCHVRLAFLKLRS